MITKLKHIGLHNCKICNKDLTNKHPLTKYCFGCRKEKKQFTGVLAHYDGFPFMIKLSECKGYYLTLSEVRDQKLTELLK